MKRGLSSSSAYRSTAMTPEKKTAIERALEEAERLGVPVTVRESKPGSGMFIARPGRDPAPYDEPSDTPHPKPSRTS